jgi:WD40 repeat protein
VFARDGTLWATDGWAGVQQWDLAEKKVVSKITVSENRHQMVQALVLTSNGKRLFTGDRGGWIREWDTGSGTLLRSWPNRGWLNSVALCPGEGHLAATGTDGFVRIYNLANGELMQEINLSGAQGRGVAFSTSRSLLISTDSDGILRGWDWKAGVPVGVPIQVSGEVLAPRFFPNGDEFVFPAGNVIYQGRLAKPQGSLLLPNDGVRVRGVEFSTQGDRLAVARGGVVSEFMIPSGERTDSGPFEPHSLSLRYDPVPSRNRLVRGLREGFDVIELPGFSQTLTVRNSERVHGVVFTPDGRQMYVRDRENVSKWDPATFARITARFRDPELKQGVEVTALDARPDGNELLVTYAKTIVFLNSTTLEKCRKPLTVADDILDAKYFPDGKKILVARRDSIAQVLDAATGAPIGPPMTHSRPLLSAAVSPDGNILVTGGRDGTARFWDARTNLPLGPPLRHSGPVEYIAYNPNGKMIATGSGLGEVLLTPTPPEPSNGTLEEMRTACKKPPL